MVGNGFKQLRFVCRQVFIDRRRGGRCYRLGHRWLLFDCFRRQPGGVGDADNLGGCRGADGACAT